MKKIIEMILCILLIGSSCIGQVKATETRSETYSAVFVNNSECTDYYRTAIEATEEGTRLTLEAYPEEGNKCEYPCSICEIDRITEKISGQRQVIMGHDEEGKNYGYIFDLSQKTLTEFRIYGDIPEEMLSSSRNLDFIEYKGMCCLVYMAEQGSMHAGEYKFTYTLKACGYSLTGDDGYFICEKQLVSETFPDGMIRGHVYCGGVYGSILIINTGVEMHCLDLLTGEWMEPYSVFPEGAMKYLSGKVIDGIYQDGAYDIVTYREKLEYDKGEKRKDYSKEALGCKWESRILLINRNDGIACPIAVGSEYGNFITDVVQEEDAVEVYVIDMEEITYFDISVIDGPMLANRAFRKITYSYGGVETGREDLRLYYDGNVLSVP